MSDIKNLDINEEEALTMELVTETPEELPTDETVEQAPEENAQALEEDTPQEEKKEFSIKEKVFGLNDDDEEEKMPELNVSDVVKALTINGKWFRKQIGVILLVVVGIILNITNRYQAQQEMIEEERLTSELLDWKYRSIIRKGELTLKSRQSQLEKQLKAMGDSTLLPCNETLYQLSSKE